VSGWGWAMARANADKWTGWESRPSVLRIPRSRPLRWFGYGAPNQGKREKRTERRGEGDRGKKGKGVEKLGDKTGGNTDLILNGRPKNPHPEGLAVWVSCSCAAQRIVVGI